MNSNLQPSIHIHLRHDGQALVLGQGPAGYKWLPIDQSSLGSALLAAKSQGASVQCSREDPDSDPSPLVEEASQFIASLQIPMKLLREPPFPLSER